MTAEGAPSVTPLDTALEHVREARQFLGERNRYRKALEEIDPAKLDRLADWFDADDARRGPGRGTEVQADLRRWAKTVRAVLNPSQPSQQEGPPA